MSSSFAYAAGEKREKKVPEKDYDVYLLIGQSNMAGREKRILPEDTARVMEGVWLLIAER